MHVIVLIGRNPVVAPEVVVGDIDAELRETTDILGGGICEESEWVMFHRIVILGRAVVRVKPDG